MSYSVIGKFVCVFIGLCVLRQFHNVFIVTQASRNQMRLYEGRIDRFLERQDPVTDLKATDVMKMIPKDSGISFLGLSEAMVTQDMSQAEAEEQFYRFVEHVDVTCPTSRRFGRVEDGGWDLCLAGPYNPEKNNCLVYSFGIGREWSFDDAISNPGGYGCMDRAFDPTIGLENHTRGDRIHFYSLGLGGKNKVDNLMAYHYKTIHRLVTFRTFASIKTALGDSGKVIDYLKIDIEYGEWDALKTMLFNSDLGHVKQLALEIHTYELWGRTHHSSVSLLKTYYDVLKDVEKAGFLRWRFHANMVAPRKSEHTNKSTTCCYEINWINVHFLTDAVR